LDIENLEDLVNRQVEAMESLIVDSQKATIPPGQTADYLPPIDLEGPSKE
jgi:hypothetical protein